MRTTVLAADNFLLPNGTMIAELVGFLIILFVLWKYVVPPLSKSLQARQDMVQKQVEDSEDAARRLKADEARKRATVDRFLSQLDQMPGKRAPAGSGTGGAG